MEDVDTRKTMHTARMRREVLRISQEIVENSYAYDAFGNVLEGKESIENRVQYTGQQYDQETGQYYLRARFYNPVIGRFTQEDTYRGDGLNLYAYCRNNPVMYYDPSGYNGEYSDIPSSGSGQSRVEQVDTEVDNGVNVGNGGLDFEEGVTLKHNATSGVKLTSVPEKTTTILGRYASDTGDIIKELNLPKSTDFSGNPGGFNLLNTPDNLYAELGAEGFWNEYNKPFLDAAISRGDEILMSTPINNSTLYTKFGELTGYGREYYYLLSKGYEYVDGKMILKGVN